MEPRWSESLLDTPRCWRCRLSSAPSGRSGERSGCALGGKGRILRRRPKPSRLWQCVGLLVGSGLGAQVRVRCRPAREGRAEHAGVRAGPGLFRAWLRTRNRRAVAYSVSGRGPPPQRRGQRGTTRTGPRRRWSRSGRSTSRERQPSRTSATFPLPRSPAYGRTPAQVVPPQAHCGRRSGRPRGCASR